MRSCRHSQDHTDDSGGRHHPDGANVCASACLDDLANQPVGFSLDPAAVGDPKDRASRHLD